MRLSQLIAQARAPKSPRLLAAGLASALLGSLLAVLATPLWLSTLGVLTTAASVMVLILAPVYRRQKEEAYRRAALASGFLAVAIVLAIFLWLQRPPADVEFKRIDSKPGAALALSGMGDLSLGHDPEEALPPYIEGSFGSIGITESQPPRMPEERIDTGAFRIRVPVASSACDRLEAELGGSCGDRTGSRHTGFHAIEIRTLESDAALSAEIRPANARTIELTKTTKRTQQRVPTEWVLTQDDPSTDVDIQCVDRAPLQIKTLLGNSVRADCAADGPTFHLAVQPAAGAHGSLFFREVGEFSVGAFGTTAEAVIEGADLVVEGSGEPLPDLPAAISLQAATAKAVELKVKQSMEGKINEVSLSSSASSVRTGDEERVSNWLQRNLELAYLIAGIFLAISVAALVDLLHVKLKR